MAIETTADLVTSIPTLLDGGDPRRYQREHNPASIGSPSEDRRSAGRRDRDRILYTTSWSRLAGVTQVVTPTVDSYPAHNRMTHSLRVAQVAKSIAENLLRENSDILRTLGGLDVDVAEAAGLAHDLGHPPYGHAGERALDFAARSILGLPDGFEGNAQTFRIATKYEARHPDHDGMNLTRATRAALLKYPWVRPATKPEPEHTSCLEQNKKYRLRWKKFSCYEDDHIEMEEARIWLPRDFHPDRQSLEASIMDVADDISYAVHDLDDYYAAGLIDVRVALDELKDLETRGPSTRFKKLIDHLTRGDYPLFDIAILRQAATDLAGIFEWLPQHPDISLSEVSEVRLVCSTIIDQLISAIEVVAVPGGREAHVRLATKAWHIVEILKRITRSFVIERSDVAVIQRAQQTQIVGLVRLLFEWKESSDDFKRLPPSLRAEVKIARDQIDGKSGLGGKSSRGSENRCIVDYVCSLTDQQCTRLYKLLLGETPSALGRQFTG